MAAHPVLISYGYMESGPCLKYCNRDGVERARKGDNL